MTAGKPKGRRRTSALTLGLFAAGLIAALPATAATTTPDRRDAAPAAESLPLRLAGSSIITQDSSIGRPQQQEDSPAYHGQYSGGHRGHGWRYDRYDDEAEADDRGPRYRTYEVDPEPRGSGMSNGR